MHQEVDSADYFLKDFGASIRNIIGGRSSSYENELLSARTKALRELEDRARAMGAVLPHVQVGDVL